MAEEMMGSPSGVCICVYVGRENNRTSLCGVSANGFLWMCQVIIVFVQMVGCLVFLFDRRRRCCLCGHSAEKRDEL